MHRSELMKAARAGRNQPCTVRAIALGGIALVLAFLIADRSQASGGPEPSSRQVSKRPLGGHGLAARLPLEAHGKFGTAQEQADVALQQHP